MNTNLKIVNDIRLSWDRYVANGNTNQAAFLEQAANDFAVSKSTIRRIIGVMGDKRNTYTRIPYSATPKNFSRYRVLSDGRVVNNTTNAIVSATIPQRGDNAGVAVVRLYNDEGTRETVAVPTLLTSFYSA